MHLVPWKPVTVEPILQFLVIDFHLFIERLALGEYSVRLTVRQIYYRLISPPYQLFANTATNYKSFDKVVTKARERKEIDWKRIEDRARGIIGGEKDAFGSPEDYVEWLFINLSEDYYERSRWNDQPNYVEVWVEKDALSALFRTAAKPYRTVVFPSRGYSSFTKVMEALERFPEHKRITVLHFGDHDPSGLDMSRDIGSRLNDYSRSYQNGGLVVKRVALDIDQVRALNLPSNPTKKADSRARDYVGRYGDACWELDAVAPDTLSQWVKEAVEREIDMTTWKAAEEKAKEERNRIRQALEDCKEEIGNVRDRVKQALDYDDNDSEENPRPA